MIVYRGMPRQQGAGLGSMLKKGFKIVTPLLQSAPVKEGLRLLKRNAKRAGIAAEHDILVRRQSPAKALMQRGKHMLTETGKHLVGNLFTTRRRRRSKKKIPKRRVQQRGKGIRSLRRRGAHHSRPRRRRRQARPARDLDIFD